MTAQAAQPPLLELAQLGMRYGSVVALHAVDATIDGTIIGLLGPNGAGKSTLLKCLLGLIPFEGDARVLGLLRGDSRACAIRDRVGYMPEQDVSFLSGLVGGRAVHVRRASCPGLPRTEAIQRAHAALYYAGLEDKRYQPIDELLDRHEAIASSSRRRSSTTPSCCSSTSRRTASIPRSREAMLEAHRRSCRRGAAARSCCRRTSYPMSSASAITR